MLSPRRYFSRILVNKGNKLVGVLGNGLNFVGYIERRVDFFFWVREEGWKFVFFFFSECATFFLSFIPIQVKNLVDFLRLIKWSAGEVKSY